MSVWNVLLPWIKTTSVKLSSDFDYFSLFLFSAFQWSRLQHTADESGPRKLCHSATLYPAGKQDPVALPETSCTDWGGWGCCGGEYLGEKKIGLPLCTMFHSKNILIYSYKTFYRFRTMYSDIILINYAGLLKSAASSIIKIEITHGKLH